MKESADASLLKQLDPASRYRPPDAFRLFDREMEPTPPGSRSPLPAKVAIIEDQAEIREGLGTLIDSAEGVCCAGQFATMEANKLARF
jgi:hypothetical protein